MIPLEPKSKSYKKNLFFVKPCPRGWDPRGSRASPKIGLGFSGRSSGLGLKGLKGLVEARRLWGISTGSEISGS